MYPCHGIAGTHRFIVVELSSFFFFISNYFFIGFNHYFSATLSLISGSLPREPAPISLSSFTHALLPTPSSLRASNSSGDNIVQAGPAQSDGRLGPE
jgi:hypothetical protein